MVKSTPICPYCHSSNILIDTYAQWDNEQQRWKITDLYNGSGRCSDCEQEDFDVKWAATDSN